MPRYECIFNDTATLGRYDRLRHIPESVLRTCADVVLDGLRSRRERARPAMVVDAGCGTGRFAIPLARRAVELGWTCEVVGLDLSQGMLGYLVDEWGVHHAGIRLRAAQCDLQAGIPLRDGSAWCVLTVAVLHILQDWTAALDNLAAVVEPGGKLVILRENNQFMHQTEGFEHDDDFPYLDPLLTEFMRFYHLRRRQHGCAYEPSPVRYSDMTVATDYVRALGLRAEAACIPLERLRWRKAHTYADILHCFRYRQMTTWGSDLPEHVRQSIATDLEKWVANRGIDIEAEFYLPAALMPGVFWKRSPDAHGRRG